MKLSEHHKRILTELMGKCPRWPEDWIFKDYCRRCPERKGCINKGGIHGKEYQRVDGNSEDSQRAQV